MSRANGSPKLEALAADIERRFPDLLAHVRPATWRSRRRAGRIIVHTGPTRHGYELRVSERAKGWRTVAEWNTADYTTRLEQVRQWIDQRAREECAAGGHRWERNGSETHEKYADATGVRSAKIYGLTCTRCRKESADREVLFRPNGSTVIRRLAP